MASRIRIHLDENVDPDVGRALRRHGIDVTTTQEAGLRAKSDTAQLDYVRMLLIDLPPPAMYNIPHERAF